MSTDENNIVDLSEKKLRSKEILGKMITEKVRGFQSNGKSACENCLSVCAAIHYKVGLCTTLVLLCMYFKVPKTLWSLAWQLIRTLRETQNSEFNFT